MRYTLNFLLLFTISATTYAGELERLEWLSGHWQSADGAMEEVWMAPKQGSMPGSFRWLFADGRQVLEYLVIEETDSGVFLRFKHFNSDFVPWEKDEPNTYRLLEATADRAKFIRISENRKVPLRITYTRKGDSLTFLGEGDEGEEPMRLDFILR